MTDVEKVVLSMGVSHLMASRQTTLPKRLVAPGPAEDQVEQLFLAAASAPDHDRINPWRFLVIPLQKRVDLGELFALALLERDPSAAAEQLEQAREKAMRGPFLMLLVVDEAKGDVQIDLSERVLSAGCAVQNILLLAHAMGYGTGLTSGKALKSQSFRSGLGLHVREHAICFLSIGTVGSRNPSKTRPDVDRLVRIWGA